MALAQTIETIRTSAKWAKVCEQRIFDGLTHTIFRVPKTMLSNGSDLTSFFRKNLHYRGFRYTEKLTISNLAEYRQCKDENDSERIQEYILV